jgi:phage head maturation protease
VTGIEYHPVDAAIECRAGTMTIGGLGIPVGTRSRPIGGRFVEVVDPGFADDAKAANYRDIISRYNHQDEFLLGAVNSGTLRLSDTKRGTDFSVDVPPWLQWVYDSTKRGDLQNASFAFAPGAIDKWDFVDSMPLRTLLKGEVIELGPCPVGAYPDATTGLRSLAAAVDAPYEDVLARADNLRSFFTRSDGGPAPAPKPVPAPAFTGRDGAEALAECRSMAPVMGRSRMLETQAQRWPAYMTQAWDAMPPTPVTPLEAAQREHAEARREVARLKDSAGLLLAELAQADLARAEQRAADYLASKSGQPISGAAALRLTREMERR